MKIYLHPIPLKFVYTPHPIKVCLCPPTPCTRRKNHGWGYKQKRRNHVIRYKADFALSRYLNCLRSDGEARKTRQTNWTNMNRVTFCVITVLSKCVQERSIRSRSISYVCCSSIFLRNNDAATTVLSKLMFGHFVKQQFLSPAKLR